MERALIIPVFKKGKRNICENYTGISLLKNGYKIYAKIMTRRLREITANLLLLEQTGFRKEDLS
jgi:hypothetical protein